MDNDMNKAKPGSQRGQDKLNPGTRDIVLLRLEWKRSLQICLLLHGILSLDLKSKCYIIYP